MAVEEETAVAEPAPHTHVGKRARKHNGDAYVTGRVTYTEDVQIPGTVHAAVVRSHHAHARIRAIDAAAALARPEVLAVLTGAEAAELAEPIPHNLDPGGLGGHHADIRCLAVDKVVYVGQPVAAVVALTSADARAAAELVAVDYEPLPAVLDAEAALAEGAPLLYEDWGSNVMISGTVGDGDFDAAAAGVEHVIDGEVRLPRSTSAPMETRSYLAQWDERAQSLTWYGTTQNPHPQRWILAQALGLSERQIRVVAPQPGGAFGLKMHGHPEEVLVAVLARKVGRPVRWVETRAECMLASGKEQVHRFEVAFDAAGRVQAFRSRVVADHGAAAAGPGWGMVFVGSLGFPTGYDIPVCTVDYTVAVTNKSPWAGARPFGKEAPALVMERVMDKIAATTGLDPIEVRRRNFIAKDAFPHTSATGLLLDSGDFQGLVDKAMASIDYGALRTEQQKLRTEGRYLGIGFGFELLPEGADIPGALVGGFDTSTVKMDPSGEVTVLTGVTSPGSGNDTAIAQIVADELGVEPEQISVVQGDTQSCPYGYGNLSSRGAVAGGGSASLAAADVATKVRTVAAAMLHVEPGEIRLAGRFAQVAAEPAKAIPLHAVAHASYSLGYILGAGIEPNLEATRTYKPSNIRHFPDDKGHITPFASYSSAFTVSVVEVEPDTGAVQLRRHLVVHDCGTMLNPDLVEGQVRGGTVMGIGAALCEELTHDDNGTPTSTAFKTYLLPRAPDLPPIEVGHQETPSPFTPFGAKGAGETGFAGAVASIANAVNDALRPLGFELDATPFSAPNVLAALTEARA